MTQIDFTDKQIWMYWPDSKACQFNENVAKGFMACGLPGNKEIGNLSTIRKVPGGIEAALKQNGITDGNKLLETFANRVKVGDYVIARKEVKDIVGIGVVVGDYEYDESRPNFKHVRKVNWIDTTTVPFPAEMRGKWNRVTLVEKIYLHRAEQIITWICNGEYDVTKWQFSTPSFDSGNIRVQDNSSYRDSGISHSSFMDYARLYQESIVQEWAKQLGKSCIWDERPNHGVWLKDEYAELGLVFYEGFRQEILGLYHAGHTKIGMNLLRNALRSEHIPYNLFFPMMKKQNKESTKDFFKELLGTDVIAEILDVKIEYAPQPKFKYLNDGTSFDTFVLYNHKDGGKGAIGIEVKYTEREYAIGETEYKNTHDESGNVRLSEHYERATRQSGYYIPNCQDSLVTDDLRQIWRNHILGASMVQCGDIRYFSSMTVFPDGNTHFHIAPEEYRTVLTDKGKSTFFTVTYEKMFEIMTHHFRTSENQKWIKYLYNRYLFGKEMPDVIPVTTTEEENNVDGFLSQNIRISSSYNSSELPIAKTLNRGVSPALLDAFKQSPIYTLYLQHKDELLICVRNNYLNVYYRLNNIAEVRLTGDGRISCGIHPYFLGRDGNSNVVLRDEYILEQIVNRYDEIKRLVENKKSTTNEKIAQQMLFLQNNANPSSKWFCVDVEWARSFNNQAEKDSCMASRMDIIAISKEVPYRVAVIELKYGKNSIDGSAGIFKHIQDFKTLKEGSTHNGISIDYYDGMCTDICNILQAYNLLGIKVPESLRNIRKNQFDNSPEFYIMTMDNNPASSRGSSPKQTMAAYLFSPNSYNYRAWGCMKPARHNVQDNLGINVLDTTSGLPVTFIFSKQNVYNINVDDILEDDSYEIIRPSAEHSVIRATQSDRSKPDSGHSNTLVVVIVVIILILLLLWLL